MPQKHEDTKNELRRALADKQNGCPTIYVLPSSDLPGQIPSNIVKGLLLRLHLEIIFTKPACSIAQPKIIKNIFLTCSGDIA